MLEEIEVFHGPEILACSNFKQGSSLHEIYCFIPVLMWKWSYLNAVETQF